MSPYTPKGKKSTTQSQTQRCNSHSSVKYVMCNRNERGCQRLIAAMCPFYFLILISVTVTSTMTTSSFGRTEFISSYRSQSATQGSQARK